MLEQVFAAGLLMGAMVAFAFHCYWYKKDRGYIEFVLRRNDYLEKKIKKLVRDIRRGDSWKWQ